MLRSIISLALVAAATLMGGCAVTSTTRVEADGSTTTTRSMEWVTGYPSGYYIEPVYGYYGRDHHRYGAGAPPVLSNRYGAGAQPVLVHRYDADGNRTQSVWVCPGGYQPVAGKC